VNVASKCGLTPQYTGLERLQERYAAQGFTVLGVPCNQFLGQEPGSAEEIAEFCSATYGVTFPLTEKVEVNGDGRHELYDPAATDTAPPADTCPPSEPATSSTCRPWSPLPSPSDTR
jgi:glutathione peroxidase-family protein